MKNFIKSVFITTVVVSISTLAFGQSELSFAPVQKTQVPQNIQPLSSELIEREIQGLYAPVKSQVDLDNYMFLNTKTPLDKLSLQHKRVFINSLVFSDAGLSDFNYSILEKSLTPTEIYGVLSMFGLQSGAGMLNEAKVETSLDRAIIDGYNQKQSKINPGYILGDRAGFDSSFGQSFNQGPFLKGYRCASAGTCAVSDGHACTSNC